MKTKLLMLAAAMISWALIGCQNAQITANRPLPAKGWVLIDSPNDLIRVGQLVDGDLNMIEPTPSRHWLSQSGNQAAAIDVRTHDKKQLAAFLKLSGVDMESVSPANFEAAVNLLSKERLSLRFVDSSVTQLDVQMLNKYPRGAFIRESYGVRGGQLPEAFTKDGEVQLVATTLSASKFTLRSTMSSKVAAEVDKLLGASLDWASGKERSVDAGKGKKVVVAVRFPPSAFKLVALKRDADMAPRETRTLNSLIPGGAVSFRLTDHGLHNGGPYHASATAEFLTERAEDRLDLSLRCFGHIENRGIGSPASGESRPFLFSYPAHWMVEFEPPSAERWSVEKEGQGDYAGLRRHGEFSTLLSAVEIQRPQVGDSKFTFKPVKLIVIRD